jgi:hypothetical protein
MTDQLIPATIVIAERTYRIRINQKDEEAVRKTVKTINDKIIEFKNQFAGKDMQDYVAMVLLWYATEQANVSTGEIANDNVTNKLAALEKMLDGYEVR